MLTNFVKRVLPFILTLIFGIGLGSIFGGSHQRTVIAPSYQSAPPAQTYRGCPNKRRNFDSSTPSQNRQSSATPTHSEPTLVSQ
jgi:hypothetical protein